MPVPSSSGVAIRLTKFHFSPVTLMMASSSRVLTTIANKASPTSATRRKIAIIMPTSRMNIGTSIRAMSSRTSLAMAGLKSSQPLSQMPSPVMRAEFLVVRSRRVALRRRAPPSLANSRHRRSLRVRNKPHHLLRGGGLRENQTRLRGLAGDGVQHRAAEGQSFLGETGGIRLAQQAVAIRRESRPASDG